MGPSNPHWICEFWNPKPDRSLGECDGEYSGEGSTPEAAVIACIEDWHKDTEARTVRGGLTRAAYKAWREGTELTLKEMGIAHGLDRSRYN